MLPLQHLHHYQRRHPGHDCHQGVFRKPRHEYGDDAGQEARVAQRQGYLVAAVELDAGDF